MDCITFTENGEEEDLRGRLTAPAENLAQDLYVSGELGTGRVMVKDEDVCLHCGTLRGTLPDGRLGHAEIGDPRSPARHLSRNIRMTTYNDFVIRFANVNGSGSASANGMFAQGAVPHGRADLHAQQFFPPTSRAFRRGSKCGLPVRAITAVAKASDLMVAMNAETYEEDVAAIVPGGYLLYDNSAGLDRRLFRRDVNQIGVPISKLIVAAYTDPRQRKLFKNIVYVGALAALLNIDFDVITGMVSTQYRGKDELIAPNIRALEMGRDYAREYLECPLPIQARRTDLIGDRIMIDGNEAGALGGDICGRHDLRLVSDHAVDIDGGGVRESRIAAARRQGHGPAEVRGHPGGKTNWRPSASSSAPPGTARARLPRPAAPACR